MKERTAKKQYENDYTSTGFTAAKLPRGVKNVMSTETKSENSKLIPDEALKLGHKTESKGSIGSNSANPKLPSLKQGNDFDAIMKNKANMERKYAEIDRIAEQYKDAIAKTGKQPATIRHSKDYARTYDKISTRYNYQTSQGIGGYIEKEKEI